MPADATPSSALEVKPVQLYLDQNYLSGIVKRKPAFIELEPVLRGAVAAGAVTVPESPVHRLESAARSDLGVLELLRELSGGRRLPDELDADGHAIARRLRAAIAAELPRRRPRPGDEADLEALALALPRCALVTTDAFMADVVRRTRLDTRHGCELFTGRRADVRRLCARLEAAIED
jgi:hypothetical protein